MSTVSTPAQVLARRRAEQRALLDRARTFAAGLAERPGVRAVVVFGSVARGDFHEASDVDVLVVCHDLPAGPVRRLAALGSPPGRVEVVAWTPHEWQRELARGNPIARESVAVGVWLRGAPGDLLDPPA